MTLLFDRYSHTGRLGHRDPNMQHLPNGTPAPTIRFHTKGADAALGRITDSITRIAQDVQRMQADALREPMLTLGTEGVSKSTLGNLDYLDIYGHSPDRVVIDDVASVYNPRKSTQVIGHADLLAQREARRNGPVYRLRARGRELGIGRIGPWARVLGSRPRRLTELLTLDMIQLCGQHIFTRLAMIELALQALAPNPNPFMQKGRIS